MDLIPELSGLQQVVQFTFLMTFIGMAAASLFFLLERGNVIQEYKSSMVLSCLICMIAAINYYYMKDIYIIGIATESGQFPTEFRYIDWLLTVPLMLTKFPTMLGFGRRARGFMLLLISLALVMLITGFIGEVNLEQRSLNIAMLVVGCFAWLTIVGMLFYALSELPESVDEVKASAIRKMSWFVTIGWVIYPLGYLAPTIGLEPDVRELVYNVGDLINKVGLALFVFAAAKAKQKALELQGIPAPVTG